MALLFNLKNGYPHKRHPNLARVLWKGRPVPKAGRFCLGHLYAENPIQLPEKKKKRKTHGSLDVFQDCVPFTLKNQEFKSHQNNKTKGYLNYVSYSVVPKLSTNVGGDAKKVGLPHPPNASDVPCSMPGAVQKAAMGVVQTGEIGKKPVLDSFWFGAPGICKVRVPIF